MLGGVGMIGMAGMAGPIGIAATAATACSPTPPAGAAAPTPSTPARGAPPRRFWSQFAESQSWPTSTADWFPSKGHYGGTSEGLVRVAPAALAAYRELTLGAKLETGTTLVMLHRSRASGKPGPVHVMQRLERGWEYWLLSPDGAIESQGDLPLCARCHADAPADGVFGPPLPLDSQHE